MPIAAVPAYLGENFGSASPGMRFGMYLRLWGVNSRTGELHWTKENKVSALAEAARINANDKAVMAALYVRQHRMFKSCPPESGLLLDAVTTAPFTTGLGNEHPLENGFAFLNPYGLPYLPGSGVKGVLRQAAWELARGEWGDSSGWGDAEITALFGPEGEPGDTLHQRGALIFWDVIPQIKGDALQVEIMTPHQSHYYQQKSDRNAGGSVSPHDSGQPLPITFLSVPPGSGFAFFVLCDCMLLRRTAPELMQNDKWKELLISAFEHAFTWCGFGAKTSVGYGAMREDPQKKMQREREEQARQEKLRRREKAAAREREIAQMDPVDQEIARYLDARPDKNQPEINALINGLKNNVWSEDLVVAIAERLKARMQAEKRWKEKSEKKNPGKDRDYVRTQEVMKYLSKSQSQSVGTSS